MKKSGRMPIKVALYGMDPRSYKTMALYLNGPCHGIAEVVSDTDAQIDIIDADFATAGEILETRRQQTPDRPIILLSLQTLKIENTHFVQKPVNAEQLTAVLESLVRNKTAKQVIEVAPVSEDVPAGQNIDQQEPPSLAQQKTTKPRKTFESNEGGYTAFLGTLSDIDFSDPAQLQNASFEPKNYLLSYVLSAYKVARHQNSPHRLNSVWKPLSIYPDTQQIWLDADDKQLRVFAGMDQSKMFAGNISLLPIDAAESRDDKAADKFQDMDAFIWKLAILTSKGRFPAGIDPNKPVYLKHWPNLTRLLLTPDALRISALLLKGARTPLQIISVLNIKPQFVFAFISACHSIGILAQSRRSADATLIPESPKPNQKQNLFSKILHKLRGN